MQCLPAGHMVPLHCVCHNPKPTHTTALISSLLNFYGMIVDYYSSPIHTDPLSALHQSTQSPPQLPEPPNAPSLAPSPTNPHFTLSSRSQAVRFGSRPGGNQFLHFPLFLSVSPHSSGGGNSSPGLPWERSVETGPHCCAVSCGSSLLEQGTPTSQPESRSATALLRSTGAALIKRREKRKKERIKENGRKKERKKRKGAMARHQG